VPEPPDVELACAVPADAPAGPDPMEGPTAPPEAESFLAESFTPSSSLLTPLLAGCPCCWRPLLEDLGTLPAGRGTGAPFPAAGSVVCGLSCACTTASAAGAEKQCPILPRREGGVFKTMHKEDLQGLSPEALGVIDRKSKRSAPVCYRTRPAILSVLSCASQSLVSESDQKFTVDTCGCHNKNNTSQPATEACYRWCWCRPYRVDEDCPRES
jgi:hypothetical protein